MYDFLKNVPRDGEGNDNNEDYDESEEECSEDDLNNDEPQGSMQNYGTDNIEDSETEYWLQELVIPNGVSF